MKEDAMASEPPVRDVRTLWQRQATEGDRMSIAEVRERSQTLLDKARRRVVFIYLMGVGNAGLALALMWFEPALRLGLGYLAVTAIVLVTWVQRRNAKRTLAPELNWAQGLACYRGLLERERDFHRDSARWFIIGPALNIIVLGLVYVASPLFRGSPGEIIFMAVILVTHVAILSPASRRLRREAGTYQAELDALNKAAAQT
jgi:hypothetical protein